MEANPGQMPASFYSSVECHDANFSRSNIPGIAMRVHPIKKTGQPRVLARNPVGAEATTLGTPMRLVRSAYWVAVLLDTATS